MKRILIIMFIFSTFALGTELHISFTGNNRGLLAPCGCTVPSGGWPRISTSLSTYPESSLHVGAGNHFFHHTPMPKEDQILEQQKADLQAEFFSELKYDVINAGQYDLCYGLKVLKSLQDRYDLPIISSTILDMDGHLVFPPYKIIDFGNIDIMFIGVSYHTDGFNYRVKDPLVALNELYQDGLFEQADLVILLADAPAGLLSEFVKEHSGIDLIVAAKEHAFTGLPVHYKGTALVQMGSQGKYLGDLALHFEGDTKEWKDISPFKLSVNAAEIALRSETAQRKKYLKQLKRSKKILKSEMNNNPYYYQWNMLLLDDSVKDDPKIKSRVDKYTPYP